MREPAAAQLDALRRHNTGAILAELVRDEAVARVELSERLGLSAGSVTKIVALLMRQGLVIAPAERRTVGEATGRPRSPLELNPDGPALLGVQIGQKRSVAVVTDLRTRVLHRRTAAHEGADPRQAVAKTVRAARSALRRAGDRRILAVGASVPGWVDHDRGLLVENAPFGWADVPLRDMLADALDLPVVLDSAPNAVALSELWLGAGRNVSDMLSVFVGNAVGSSVVFDRRLVRGRDSSAGTLTHFSVPDARGERCTCGRRDCLQVTVTNGAVLKAAQEEGVASPGAGVEELWRLADKGEPAALRLLGKRARRLASVLSQLADLLAPELVVLSGLRESDVDQVRTAMTRLRAGRDGDSEVPLHKSEWGPDGVAVASAVLALDAFVQDPLRFERNLTARHPA